MVAFKIKEIMMISDYFRKVFAISFYLNFRIKKFLS